VVSEVVFAEIEEFVQGVFEVSEGTGAREVAGEGFFCLSFF